MFNLKENTSKKKDEKYDYGRPSKKNESPKNLNQKPKLEGLNYFEIVNKLINSNNDDSNMDKKQRIEEAHDYLFEMEKKKYTDQNEDRQAITKKSKVSPKNIMPK